LGCTQFGAGFCPFSRTAFRCQFTDAEFAAYVPTPRGSIAFTARTGSREAFTGFITKTFGDDVARTIPSHIATGGFKFANTLLTGIVDTSRVGTVFTAGLERLGHKWAFTGIFTGAFGIFSTPLPRAAFDAFFIPGNTAAVGKQVANAFFADSILCTPHVSNGGFATRRSGSSG